MPTSDKQTPTPAGSRTHYLSADGADEFLGDIVNKKKKDLAAIEVDKSYWAYVSQNLDEEELRSELKEENEKKQEEGEEPDESRVNELENKIELVKRAKKQLQQLSKMQKQIEHYLEHLENPSDALNEEVEHILE